MRVLDPPDGFRLLRPPDVVDGGRARLACAEVWRVVVESLLRGSDKEDDAIHMLRQLTQYVA